MLPGADLPTRSPDAPTTGRRTSPVGIGDNGPMPNTDSGQLRLMAVHAHPDDESSKGAATMAKYVAEGVDVVVFPTLH